MALNRRARGGGTNDRKDERGFKSEEFVPSSDWTEDSHAHFLLVDLPGFKKEDVKVQVEVSGQVTIKGERRANDKIHFFEKTYRVPEGADVAQISATFEGEFLYVTLPKQVIVVEEKHNNAIQEKIHKAIEIIAEKAEASKKHEKRFNEGLLAALDDSKEHKNGHGHEKEKNEINEAIRKVEKKKKGIFKKHKKMLKNATKEFKRNKMGFLLTAFLSFSLGCWWAVMFIHMGTTGLLCTPPSHINAMNVTNTHVKL